jgi:hypothetical protein
MREEYLIDVDVHGGSPIFLHRRRSLAVGYCRYGPSSLP